MCDLCMQCVVIVPTVTPPLLCVCVCVQRLLEEDQVERSHQQENEVLEKTLALNEKVTTHMPEV